MAGRLCAIVRAVRIANPQVKINGSRLDLLAGATWCLAGHFIPEANLMAALGGKI